MVGGNMFFNALSTFLQYILDALALTLNTLFGFFPSSPFRFLSADSEIASLLAKVNYFVPVYEFVAILQAWLICVGVYYLYSIWARWVKAID